LSLDGFGLVAIVSIAAPGTDAVERGTAPDAAGRIAPAGAPYIAPDLPARRDRRNPFQLRDPGADLGQLVGKLSHRPMDD